MKQTAINALLSKVNAPYDTYASALVLAAQIPSPSMTSDYIGQVHSFFSELPVNEQLAFASQYNISQDELKKAAVTLSELSGTSVPLAA